MGNSNIKLHNKPTISCRLFKRDYWDFHLARPRYGSTNNSELCLSSFIDASNECVKDNNSLIISKNEWGEAINNGIKLENIGMTGVDNGRYNFSKKISEVDEKDFNKVFYDSIYESNSKKLSLKSVKSNNRKINLPTPIIQDNSFNFNGGFYQGFFCTDKCDYKVLPIEVEDGIMYQFEMKINSNNTINTKNTLNTINPNAGGIFFYIGTRAENKWSRYYNTNTEHEPILTKSGMDVTRYGQQYVQSDNKHLMFDRTEDGFTTENWVEGTEVQYEINKNEFDENPFLLFNRTENGYTAKNIKEKREKNSDNGYFNSENKYITEEKNNYYKFHNSEKYDILEDLYNNALAFQIKDNKIGYKYLVRDCESETQPAYKIESEFSTNCTIKNNTWFKLFVRIIPDSSHQNMRLMFYLNGSLILISRWLPILQLRKLNDEYEKQEGVPFNISLGGGTLGLYDSIYPDYKEPYNFKSELFNNFGGSFIGNIKNFKIYSCNMSYEDIQNLSK